MRSGILERLVPRPGHRWTILLTVIAIAFSHRAAVRAGDDSPTVPDRTRLAELIPDRIGSWRRDAIGVTRHDTPLVAWVADADLNPSADRMRILLIGGLDGTPDSTAAVHAALRWFASDACPAQWRERCVLSAVPLVNPDGISRNMGRANLSGGDPSAKFPPTGSYYNDPRAPESQYVWRWMGLHAPDLVVVVQTGPERTWRVPPALQLADCGVESGSVWGDRLAADLGAARDAFPANHLVAALGRESPSGLGPIPAIAVDTTTQSDGAFLRPLVEHCALGRIAGPSPARKAWQQRVARTPLQVLEQLNQHYGKALPAVEYIPAIALVARLRLGELTGDPQQRADVLKIVAPYTRGEKPTTPGSGSGQSGHLIFSQLARQVDDPQRGQFLKLVRVAADQAFTPQGEPLEAMPYHLEMSDAFFMGGPILAAAGRLTGESRYFDAAARHFQFMRKLDLRPDGLYRHSPLHDTAWGRGNGFVALGYAMSLSDWPADRADRRDLVEQHAAHLRSLLNHQDPRGCWHQIVDHPESYGELSCTCMITWSMARGVREGRLDRQHFDQAIRRGWTAILQRVAPDGRLIDVCTGTGKMKSQRDYYDREAILGLDLRGGAMSMLVAAEMAEYLGKER